MNKSNTRCHCRLFTQTFSHPCRSPLELTVPTPSLACDSQVSCGKVQQRAQPWPSLPFKDLRCSHVSFHNWDLQLVTSSLIPTFLFQLNSTFSPHNGIGQKWGNGFLCESLCLILFREHCRVSSQSPGECFSHPRTGRQPRRHSPDDGLAGWNLEEMVPNSCRKNLLAPAQQHSSQLKSLSSFMLHRETLSHRVHISADLLLGVLKTGPLCARATSLSHHPTQTAPLSCTEMVCRLWKGKHKERCP